MKTIAFLLFLILPLIISSQNLVQNTEKILISSVEKIESFKNYKVSVAYRLFEDKCMYYVISISPKSSRKEIIFHLTYTQDTSLIIKNPDYLLDLDSLTKIIIINNSCLKIDKVLSRFSNCNCIKPNQADYLKQKDSFSIPNIYHFKAVKNKDDKTIEIQYSYEFYGNLDKQDRPIPLYHSNNNDFYYDTINDLFKSRLFWDFKYKYYNESKKNEIENYVNDILDGVIILN